MGKRLMLAVFVLLLSLALPGIAQAQNTTSNPYPINGDSNGASPNVTLTWTAGLDAATTNGNDVYLGTNQAAVLAATHASPEWQGTQTAASFTCSGLTPGTTYYWRVDALNPSVSPYVWANTSTWSFTVFNGSGLPAGYTNGYATWVTDSTQQINAGTSVGSTTSASICMSMNESTGFEIGISPYSTRRLDHVSVVTSNLTSGSNTIPASSISWLLVGFMESSVPGDSTYHADILLPVTNFNMAATAGNVGVLVTVQTTTSTPPGTYTGSVTVQTDSGVSTVVPVTVTVWNITLPSGPGHTANSFSLTNTEKTWAAGEYWAYGDMMLQYRLNPDDINGRTDDQTTWGWGQTDKYADLHHFLAGGMTKFCIVKADNYITESAPYTVDSYLQGWISSLPSDLQGLGYFYGYDEKDLTPSPAYGGLGNGYGALAPLFPSIPRTTTAHLYVQPWFNPLGDMTTYSTTGIIAGSSLYNYANGVLLRNNGYQYQLYHDGENIEPTSNNQMYPRTTFWTQYDLKADAFLYYSVDLWVGSPNPPEIDPTTGPFITGHQYDTSGDNYEPNGNGELLYVGTNGPLASLRMYNSRDGIQDYEYLYLLKQKINDIEVAREMSEYVTGVPLTTGTNTATVDPPTLLATRAAIAAWITQPYLAMSPSPSHRSIGNATTSQLQWVADHPDQVNSFNVYFGTDKTAVLNATTSSPQYMGNQSVTNTSFNPGTLLDNTEYYWRIDEVVSGTVYKGYVFAFNCSYGLCGWWNFDEASGTTALDSSGRNINGTLGTNVTRVAGAYGAGAVSFAGTGNVSIPAAALSTVNQEVSVAFWQYGAPAQPQSEVTFEALTASGGVVIRGRVPDSDGAVHFDAGSSDTLSVSVPLWLVKDAWNHWVFTKNSNTGNMYIYLNGTQLATSGGNMQTMGVAVALTIGSKNNGGQGYEGMVDEFRLYDTDLQASDVTTLYNSYGSTVTPPINPEGENLTYFAGNQGLIGHWSFDELTGSTVRDDSNYHNDGTLNNANQTRTTGIIGSSLLFNGTSDYVTIPINGLNIPGKAMTLSLWTYGDSSLPNTSNSYGSVAISATYVKPTDGTQDIAFTARIPAKDGSITFLAGDSNGTPPDTGVVSSSLYKGQWNQWVFSRDPAGYVYIYCNGVYIYSAGDYYETAIGQLTSFRIGSGYPVGFSQLTSGYAPTAFYKGMIDEVRLYNYYLPQTQVTALYNADLTKFAGQIGRWKFDEGTGSTTADTTSFNNTGTITSASWVNGRIGSALNFNGSSGNVAIAAGALSPLDRKVTVTFWQYGAATLPSSNYILEALDAAGGTTLRATVPGPSGNIIFDSGFGGASQTDEASNTTTSGNYQNQWNHWAFTKNAYTGQMEIYLNGSPWLGATAKYRPITPATSFKIGSKADGSATSAGTIDDVRIYNLELNATDINNIYRDCPPWPNPMTWATPPYATSPYAITMVATTATHPNGVSYFFQCTSGGGTDSNTTGWQSSPVYNVTGLSPLTSYTYEVMARENVNDEETGYSPALSASTFGTTLWNLTVQSSPVTGVNITGSSAGTTNYGPVSVYDQSPVDITAPMTCTSGGSLYNFVNWTVNGVSQPAGQTELTFTIGQNTTAVAVYQEQTWTANIQSTPATGATITSTTGSGGVTNYSLTIDDDSMVNITAPSSFVNSGTHYNFAYWTHDGVNQTAGQTGLTFTINANSTAVAVYTVQTWNLAVQSTPTGAAITGSSPGTANYNATVNDNTGVSLTAPASFVSGGALYNFAYWTLGGVSQTAGQLNLSFTMSADATAVAVYTIQTWSLAVQSTPVTGVSITGSSAGTANYAATLDDDSSVSLTAPATYVTGGTHYNFAYWTLNSVNQTAGQTALSFTINANATAIAVYTVQTWTLTVQSVPTGDVITGSSAGTTNYTATVNDNTSVSLTAPSSFVSGGSLYNFSYWTLGGVNQTAGQTGLSFTIGADATAIAVYAEQTWSLTVQSTPTGAAITGSSSGTTNYTATVNDNSSVSLTAPSSFVSGGAHYNFAYWTLNSVDQTAGQANLSFTINANATAVAVYTEQTWTLTVQSSPATGAAITGSSAGTTNYSTTLNDNSSVSLTAPASFVSGTSHYNFVDWTLNGVTQATGQTSLSFNIGAATTAVAVYQYSYGLCGWWKFDESSGTTATDSSGVGNNGTLNSYVTRVAGAIGSGAVSFAGSGTVTIPAAALGTVQTQVSVAFWQYGAPAQPQSEVSFEALTSTGSVVIRGRVPDSDGAIHFDAGSSDTVTIPVPLWEVKDSWNHWVFTKNCTTGTMKIYLNGALLTSASGTTQSMAGAVAMTIGSKNNGAQGYEGTFDDFRLYDSELQATDVTTLYDSYVTADGPPEPTDGGATYTYFNGGQMLMGHWAFDELSGTTVRDDSNFHNDGTLNNSGQTRTTGIIGSSLLFNGTSDYVSIPVNGLSIPGKALTLSLWTYGDSSLPNSSFNYGSVSLSAIRSDGSTAFLVSTPANDGSIFYRGGGDSGPDTRQSSVVSSSLYEGQWNHWVFCRDVQGYVYMYCNGTLVHADDNWGTDTIGTIATFRIGTGCAGGPASCYYKGQIDEVRMYNYFLTQSQVTALYNSDLTKFTGQIGRWKFDEGTGSTTADATPFNNTGTITNASWVTGHIGSALSFNGSSGNVAIAAAALASLDRKVTVTFWQYGAATLPSSNYILEALDAAGGATLRATVPGPSGNVIFDSGYGGAAKTDTVQNTATASNYQGQWNHWAFTKNAYTGQMEIYLNGQPWQGATGMYRPLTPAAAFKIGSKSDGSATSAGIIDDVRIYNLELNAADINNIYLNN